MLGRQTTITTAQLNEQVLKYLRPEVLQSPEAPGPCVSRAAGHLTIPGGGEVFILPVVQGRGGDPRSHPEALCDTGCKRQFARWELYP